MPQQTVQDKLAAAGGEMIRRIVGQTALSTAARLKQLDQQFGHDAVVAAIGSEAELTNVGQALDALSTVCNATKQG